MALGCALQNACELGFPVLVDEADNLQRKLAVLEAYPRA